MESTLSPVNCFVDDLMDQGIINVDFNFGGIDEEPVSGQFKSSPSHESDSGVSNMASPSPSSLSDDPDFTDLQTPGFDIFDEAIDNELVGYLATNDARSPSPEVFSLEPEIDVSGKCFQSEIKNKQNGMCKQVLRTRTVNKKSPIPKQLAESKMDVDKTNRSASKNLPPVKVIKVISTPSNSSKIDTDNRIYEALDERNRKNAVQAKINREKKKAYIKTLENDIENLRTENAELKCNQQKCVADRTALEEEIAYLKNIIANQSALSGLLQNIPNVKNVKLSSSFKRRRGAEHDHDYQESSAKRSRSAGVCLHVNKDNVSLEFCSRCSKNANMSDEDLGE